MTAITLQERAAGAVMGAFIDGLEDGPALVQLAETLAGQIHDP